MKQPKFSFTKKHRFLFGFDIILMIFTSLMSVGIAFVLKEILSIGIEGNVKQLKNFLCVLVVYLFIYGFIAILEGCIKNTYLRVSMVRYKNYIVEKLLNKNAKEFKKHTIGEYLSIFTNDMKIIEDDCAKGLLSIVQNLFLFVFGLAAMIYIDYRVTIVICIASLLPTAVALIFANSTAKKQKEVSNNNSIYTSSIKDVLSGLTVIRTFNVISKVFNVLKDKGNSLEKSKERYNNKVNIVQVMSTITGFCVVIITFGFSTWLALKGKLEIASVIAFVQLLNYLLNPIQQISILFNKYNAAKGIMNKIEDAISVEDVTNKKMLEVNNLKKGIELKDVSYYYEENDKKVLDNVSVEFEKGKAYAIVGPSGSGKTTLINAVMDQYSDYSGNIMIDDNDIKDIDPNCISNVMSLIQQDVFIFNDTLENNIKMYCDYSDEQVEKVIKLVRMNNVVSERGADYSCGENGSNLSGGEKQRISIARALIKKTPVLVLDEATAALDNETAQSIENTILSLDDVTRIVVTHKLNESILKQYDRVIMMKNGKIAEIGTFDELIERKGDFYSLFNICK